MSGMCSRNVRMKTAISIILLHIISFLWHELYSYPVAPLYSLWYNN